MRSSHFPLIQIGTEMYLSQTGDRHFPRNDTAGRHREVCLSLEWDNTLHQPDIIVVNIDRDGQQFISIWPKMIWHLNDKWFSVIE